VVAPGRQRRSDAYSTPKSSRIVATSSIYGKWTWVRRHRLNGLVVVENSLLVAETPFSGSKESTVEGRNVRIADHSYSIKETRLCLARLPLMDEE